MPVVVSPIFGHPSRSASLFMLSLALLAAVRRTCCPASSSRSGGYRTSSTSSNNMSREVIKSDKAPGAIGPYSQAIRANGFLFVSGQVGFDPAVRWLRHDDFDDGSLGISRRLIACISRCARVDDGVCVADGRGSNRAGAQELARDPRRYVCATITSERERHTRTSIAASSRCTDIVMCRR